MSLTEQDLNRIGEVVKVALGPIYVRLAEGEKDFRRIDSTLMEHDHELFGNGKPALRQEIAALRQAAQAESDIKKGGDVFKRAIMAAMISAIITAIVGGGATATVWFIRATAPPQVKAGTP
jgi:hypothetical protein